MSLPLGAEPATGHGQVAGDLSLFTVKTLIAGRAGVVVALVVFPLRMPFLAETMRIESHIEGGAFGDEFALEDEQPQPPGLPFGRKKPPGAESAQSAQYLKVERLNERLESFSSRWKARRRDGTRRARGATEGRSALGDELD